MAARRKTKRKRDAKGHFIKSRTAKRKRPATKRRKARKATKVRRVTRKLGRKPNGKFTARRRHRVKGHHRKVGRSRKRKHIKAHLSYEAAPKANPRRRRRARAAREEEVMPKRRRRRAKRSSAPRRRRRHVARENPVKRRRRRRVARENPVKRRRRRARRVSTKALCRRPSRKRPRYVTIGRTSRRRKSVRRRRGASRRRYEGSNVSPIHPYPFGQEYAMENPLGGGELLLAGLSATVGYVLTDLLDRWLAAKELASVAGPTGSTAMPVSQAVLSKPGIYRILAQAGAAAAPLAAAYYIKEPMGRAALQGAGIGALVHLGGELFTHYVMTKFVSGAAAPAAGATPSLKYQMDTWYAGEIAADNAQALYLTGTAGTLSGPRPQRGGVRAFQVPRALGTPPGVAGCGPCGSGQGDSMAAAAAIAAGWNAQGSGDGTGVDPTGDPGASDGSGESHAMNPPIFNGGASGGGNGSNNGASGGGNGTSSGNGNGTTLLAGIGKVPTLNQMFPE